MKPQQLRSANWFGRSGKDGFIYRAWLKNQGIPDYEFCNKPVIGICNTWSELTPCNAHFRELAESVKRGIYEAGGFPVEFPGAERGYVHLYINHVQQAHLGADMDFLQRGSGSAVLRDSH